jgi:hypothetical protein
VVSVEEKHDHIDDDKNLPQRSPTVTAEHIKTCFGAAPNAPMRKPSLPLDSPITSTTVEMPAQMHKPSTPMKLGNPPHKTRNIKGQKSMPSLVNASTIAPSGPAPTCPLPALPAGVAPCSTRGTQKKRCAPSTRCPSPVGPKHAHVQSATSTTSTSPTDSAESPQSSAAAHTRNNSSISSFGSVQHVTAWLASPKIAAFSAKYETGRPPKLDVAFEKDITFSSSFGHLVT